MLAHCKMTVPRAARWATGGVLWLWLEQDSPPNAVQVSMPICPSVLPRRSMGGIFGGRKGAGIGALAGAGGGFVTQAFTGGKEVRVPAESVLGFQLVKTLILQPMQ
jgi:hypothetical protein